MTEQCKERIFSEEYLDYLVEVIPGGIGLEGEASDYCYELASNRFAVLYERGTAYNIGPYSGIKVIPHCYGLLSSDQVLESAGIYRVRRQAGLNLFGQGIMVGFVDTGACVNILSE